MVVREGFREEGTAGLIREESPGDHWVCEESATLVRTPSTGLRRFREDLPPVEGREGAPPSSGEARGEKGQTSTGLHQFMDLSPQLLLGRCSF